MKPLKSLVIFVFFCAVLIMSACSSPAAAPTVQAIAMVPATATSAPPTNTLVPPTDTPVPPTDTPVPPTETPTLTATSTSTLTPAAMATLTPTATLVPATATRKPSPRPSATPVPAGPKYPAPILTAPSNGFGYSCRNDLVLSWNWSGAPLQGNEWFDVEFTVQGKGEWFSAGWTKETQLVLSPSIGMLPGTTQPIAVLLGAGSTKATSSGVQLATNRVARTDRTAHARSPGIPPASNPVYLYPIRPECKAPWLPAAGSYEWKVRVIRGVQGSGKVDAISSPDSEIRVFTYSGPQVRP